MKVYSTIALLVTILYVAYADDNKSHDWHLGTMRPGDYLLWKGVVKEGSKFLQKITKDVEFPKIAGRPESQTISYIAAYDQHQDGDGGYVSLLEGGDNEKRVKLHFKSKRGHGIDFRVEIYGH